MRLVGPAEAMSTFDFWSPFETSYWFSFEEFRQCSVGGRRFTNSELCLKICNVAFRSPESLTPHLLDPLGTQKN